MSEHPNLRLDIGSGWCKVVAALPSPEPSATHLVIIPSYNTGSARLVETVREAREHWAPVWVVIDGSTDGSEAALAEAIPNMTHVEMLRHEVNQGKGAALLTGARAAHAEGFTHFLAFDADGQHPAEYIPRYMAHAAAHPGALLNGVPQFPDNAPRERVRGRKVATIGVNILTAWWGAEDVMFGMRGFPIGALLRTMERTRAGRRYDFECLSAVRLAWAGVPVLNVKTPVRYFSANDGGVSHYNYWRDNWRLIRLFLLYLPCAVIHWPRLVARRCAGKSRIRET